MEKYVRRRRRSGFGRNKWALVGGDWLIARSTHPDQLDQLRSPSGGIWEELMARTYASWSFFSVSTISKICPSAMCKLLKTKSWSIKYIYVITFQTNVTENQILTHNFREG